MLGEHEYLIYSINSNLRWRAVAPHTDHHGWPQAEAKLQLGRGDDGREHLDEQQRGRDGVARTRDLAALPY